MTNNCRFAFGVHVLSVLALHPEANFSSEALAATVNTNAVVIRRLLLDLKEAGLLATQRGPGGGARLSRPAQEISLLEIYRAVSGAIEPFGTHPNTPAQCCVVGREIQNVLENVAEKARGAVQTELQNVSLAEVLNQIQNAPAPTP